VLDLSIPDINLIPISIYRKISSSSGSSASSTSRGRTSKKRINSETIYKILGQFRSLQQTKVNDDAKLYLIIVGNNNQTEKLFLSNNQKDPIESTAIDIGKVS
jgi:hypothetical protein